MKDRSGLRSSDKTFTTDDLTIGDMVLASNGDTFIWIGDKWIGGSGGRTIKIMPGETFTSSKDVSFSCKSAMIDKIRRNIIPNGVTKDDLRLDPYFVDKVESNEDIRHVQVVRQQQQDNTSSFIFGSACNGCDNENSAQT